MVPTCKVHTIDNHECEVATRELLGHQILPGTAICKCQERTKNIDTPTKLTDQHARNCPLGGGPQARHADIINLIRYALRHAGVKSQLEVAVTSKDPNLTNEERNCRYDVSFVWNGRKYHLDITSVNPSAQHNVRASAITPLNAANKKSDEKSKKYNRLTDSHDFFLPMAFESTGAMHENVIYLLKKLSPLALGLPPLGASYAAPTFVTFFVQALSLAIAAANARKLLRLRDLASSGQVHN